MNNCSLLNTSRPLVFCPGCAHEKVTKSLDKAFQNMGLNGSDIVIVSDIGCSGLFDTFFNTHAMHGLHGRTLTYAAGIKMARPDLKVIATIGDGGIGIGGAHFLAACRRNLDITLLVLNNFNFGMTGGQFSVTTPADSTVGSGFLNRLEKPLDITGTAQTAGAAYVVRCSGYAKDLPELIADAINFEGFAVMDIWGICPGRFAKRNRLTVDHIKEKISSLPSADGIVKENQREEYSKNYRKLAAQQKQAAPIVNIEPTFAHPKGGRHEAVILGKAGQRIVTAGELLCMAALYGGFSATQKNDYPITVLRGHSISEIILSSEKIDYIGIDTPSIIIAIGQEGIDRRKDIFENLDKNSIVILAEDVKVPENNAVNISFDFKANGINPNDRAAASLAMLAKMQKGITKEMLEAAFKLRFKGDVLNSVIALTEKVFSVDF